MGVFGKSEEVFFKVLLKLGFLGEGFSHIKARIFHGEEFHILLFFFFKWVNWKLFKTDGGGGGSADILYNMEKPNYLN